MIRRRKLNSKSVVLPWEQGSSRLADWLSFRAWGRLSLALVVAGCAAGVVYAAIAQDKRERTYRTIGEVHQGLMAYRRVFGRCPDTVAEFVGARARLGHRFEQHPADAWGQPLWIKCPGRYDPLGADVISAGPSGSFLDGDNIP